MSTTVHTLLDRLLFRRALKRWRTVAENASTVDLTSLRELRGPARQLRRELDRALTTIDARLALPLIGSNVIRKPLLSDWAWRPDIWRVRVSPPGAASVENRSVVGPGAAIFHDCGRAELAVRQTRNSGETDLAPFGFRMDVFRFEGSFLSLAIDLPEEAVGGLTLRHLIQLNATVDTENPIEITARLNIKHGPNTEQITRTLPLDAEEVAAEFDLAYTKLNEKRVERAWIDLIFEEPGMNQIVLRDLTLSRRPRAEL